MFVSEAKAARGSRVNLVRPYVPLLRHEQKGNRNRWETLLPPGAWHLRTSSNSAGS